MQHREGRRCRRCSSEGTPSSQSAALAMYTYVAARSRRPRGGKTKERDISEVGEREKEGWTRSSLIKSFCGC